jgi:hypothetical protein
MRIAIGSQRPLDGQIELLMSLVGTEYLARLQAQYQLVRSILQLVMFAAVRSSCALLLDVKRKM